MVSGTLVTSESRSLYGMRCQNGESAQSSMSGSKPTWGFTLTSIPVVNGVIVKRKISAALRECPGAEGQID